MASQRAKRRAARIASRSYQLDGVDLDAQTYAATLCGEAAGSEVYDPRASQIVDKDGAWVMITRQLPPIENAMDTHVRVGRFFWAEHMSNADDDGFTPDGTYKMQLHTEWGDVCILPYEYSVIAFVDLLDMYQAGELIFHTRNMHETQFNQIVFYARSRGIGLAAATALALGTLRANVGWFEPTPALAEECEALEQHVHRWKSSRTIRKPMMVKLTVDGETHELRYGGEDVDAAL